MTKNKNLTAEEIKHMVEVDNVNFYTIVDADGVDHDYKIEHEHIDLFGEGTAEFFAVIDEVRINLGIGEY